MSESEEIALVFPLGTVASSADDQPGLQAAQTSPAALLPQEILTRIMELALTGHKEWFAEIHEEEDEEVASRMSSLSVLTAVCKSWVAPARTAFYRDHTQAVLFKSSQLVLLYDSLQRSDPPLGKLIRKFDPGEALMEAGKRVLKRFLDVMPLLDELSIWVHQFKILCKHPHWNRLKSLRIRQDIDGDTGTGRLEENDFPARLTSIEVDGRTDLLSEAPKNLWNRLYLPHIKRFVISNPSLVALGSHPPPAARILPTMPRLESLEINFLVRAEYLQPWLVKVIEEVASSIKKLVVRRNHYGSFPLDPSLAAKLSKLEVFEYDGPAGQYSAPLLANCFPQALRRLEITWSGSAQFGIDIFRLLQDSTFLANLHVCPVFVRSLSFIPPGSGEIKSEEKVALYEEASKAYKQIMLRPNIMRRESTSIEMLYPEVDGVYCLPSPLPYLSSIHFRTRPILEELMASGRIAGYNAD
ncbi:hypothetical protein P389DRAFT_50730 [Cystobasidium minutum MCA 4210]|uniref:uncharacterized protein n=1 Tax=Cystobasidium minutum MCA 4210 TaxID=1397322 RepID=UPI0034CE0E94|eukprot:jgi/Rhomi1/50730/CE50729_492